MNQTRIVTVAIAILLLASSCSLLATQGETTDLTPALFIPNRGQAPASVLFTAQGTGVRAMFEESRVWLGKGQSWIPKELDGASRPSSIVPLEILSGTIHYVGQSESSRSMTPYSGISYRDVYKGIRMEYKAHSGRLKSEFIVAPYADWQAIRVRYPQATLSISSDGALIVAHSGAILREEPPDAYQVVEGRRVPVMASYRIMPSGSVGFDLGAYDVGRELVIDPVVTFSTYFGGTNGDVANAVATDLNGNTYVAGWTESVDLPTTVAPNLRGSGADAFVLKLNSAGALVFLTVFGGFGEEKALGIAIASNGNIYVSGSTASPNFPITSGSSLRGSMDVFATRLSSNGQMVWSILLGGDQHESAFGIATDTSGNAYLVGETSSPNFPTAPSGSSVFGGKTDAFITKLTAAGAIAYSRFLGGSQLDRARSVAVDSSGHAYVTGGTESTNFPLITPIQAFNRGGMDAFITKLNGSGVLLYSSYLGGTLGSEIFPEEGEGIAVDSAGRALVVGTTASSNFPVLNAAQAQYGGGSTDAFLSTVAPSGQSLLFSTFIGGTNIDYGKAISIDISGSAYFAGQTASSDFPSTLAYGPTGGDYQAFAGLISSSGAISFNMLVGGTGADTATGIASSAGDSAVMVGLTSSLNLPLLGALQTTNNGGLGSFIVKFTNLRTPQLTPTTPASVSGTSQLLSLQATDANGWSDIGAVHWRIGTSCQLRYLRASNTFQVLNDAGAAYSTTLTPQTNSVIGNSSCQLSGTETSVTASSSSTLVLQVRVTLLPSYTGTHAIFIETSDSTASTGWQAAGTWVNAPAPVSNGLGFHPVAPCRIVDTRTGQFTPGLFGPPQLSAYGSRNLPVTSSSCNIPLAAQVFSLNMTVVPSGPLGFLSTWPTGLAFPGVSTLNSPGGSVLANAAMVPAGTQGSVTVLSSNPTNLIVDANGYFAAPTPGDLVLYPVTPCRAVDTRNNQGRTGAFGPPALSSYSNRSIPLRSSCGMPSSATAYVVNVTAVPQRPLDFLSIWPTGQPYPGVSTLNSPEGSVIANAAIVPAGTDGSITIVASNPTDIILDVSGYFATDNGTGNGLRLYPLPPCRVVDTRAGQGKTGNFGPPRIGAYAIRNIPVQSSSCNIPSSARVYSLNITAVPQGALDFLTVWPSHEPYPGVSTLNSPLGRTIANAAIVPAGLDGSINVVSANPTDLIIDINGYFAP